MNKKIVYGCILGAILGILCIIGASLRMPDTLTNIYLLSFWYNRLMIGFIIGLLPSLKSFKLSLLRGLIIGALVSFAFYSATEFLDLMGFFAGLLYGFIIEAILFKLKQLNKI